jgi:hypothetical protein
MAAGGSSTNFVYIKLATAKEDTFAYLETGGLTAAQVAALACSQFSRWRLDAGQVRIHLVAESGEEPSDEAICAALARRHLSLSATVPSGAWLVAVPAAPAGGSGGGASTSQGPLPPIPVQPLPSPTSAHARCFLTNDQVGFLCAPATLPCDASVAAAFRKLLERAGGDTRGLMKERAMYASASSLLPTFARKAVQGVGTVSAQALFTAAGLRSGAWEFSPSSQPELHVCADTSPSLLYRPGFNGEVKSAGDGLALEQDA